MNNRLTGIRLKNLKDFDGLAEWGLKTHEEMIINVRAYAEQQRRIFEAVLNAADDDFITETYLGAIVMRDKKIVKPKDKP